MFAWDLLVASRYALDFGAAAACTTSNFSCRQSFRPDVCLLFLDRGPVIGSRAPGSPQAGTRAGCEMVFEKIRSGLSPFPPVPWLLAVVFLFLPLGLLLHVWPLASLVVIMLGVAMPILYARFDR